MKPGDLVTPKSSWYVGVLESNERVHFSINECLLYLGSTVVSDYEFTDLVTGELVNDHICADSILCSRGVAQRFRNSELDAEPESWLILVQEC